MNCHLLILLAAVMTAANCLDANANVYSHNKVVVCYVASWAAYRPGNGSFTWDNIDPSLCTHIVYAFAGMDNKTFAIESMDPFLDLPDGGGRAQYKKMMSLKERHPKLKITVAVGGWNEGSAKYSDMAVSSESRNWFVQSSVSFVRKHGFDGLDMDWEYPSGREGSRIEDRDNFVELLNELRHELDKYGLMLTVALGAAPATIKKGYDIPAISAAVDLLHIMCYDYHGSWDGQTGHNAPLRLPEGALLEEDHRLSIEDTVKFFLSKGAPRHKMVLGIPFYGRTFTLSDLNLNHNGALTLGTGFQGPYTREDGFLGYNEICIELNNGTWIEEWDDVAGVPFMHREERWVSYDNHRSISMKCKYAYAEQLAGVMVWAIDNDDFKPECSSVRYPMLRTISSIFKVATDEDQSAAATTSNSIPDRETTAGSRSSLSSSPFTAALSLLLGCVFITFLW